MTKIKTRHDNNFHCFDDAARGYWLAMAQGFQLKGFFRGAGSWTGHRRGSLPIEVLDSDGFVMNNGGIERPQELKLREGTTLFRFFRTIDKNRYGANAALSGSWWIDFENLSKVREYAEDQDIPLSQAANYPLVIPPEWGDCGYLCKARLTHAMKVFGGKGAFAANYISPANLKRDPSVSPLHGPLPGTDILQFFIPGSRQELSAAFAMGASGIVQVSKKGAFF